jgi:hypothetical protein
MKHTKEEIINALKIIKGECEDHPVCNICPFWSPGSVPECQVSNQYPEDWKINNAEPELWRAFK